MTKFGLYIVILAIAFNNLQFSQFAKLPVLLEHFKEHRQRDAGITLIAFLSMHYWGKDINDNDESRDRQLPFKDATAIGHFSSCDVPLHPIKAPSPVSLAMTTNPHPLQEYYPDAELSALFRPPQA